MPDCGRAFDAGSPAYLHQYSTEALGIVSGWLYLREESDINFRKCGYQRTGSRENLVEAYLKLHKLMYGRMK